MKKFFMAKKIAWAALSAALLLACRSNDDPVKARAWAIKNLYKKGVVKVALANSFESNKSMMVQGALLAKEKIQNDNLCPVHIEFVKFDDGGNSTSGTLGAYQIASDNELCAVIGHGYSDISLPCSLIYQYYGILHFNFVSTLHAITERGNPLAFSNMPTDVDFGEAAAELCDKNGYKNIIVYYLENRSGTSLSNSFELNCSKLGINIASRESYESSSSEQEIERDLKRVKNNFSFDCVFLASRMPDIQTIIELSRKNGITCPIVGADPFDDPLLAAALPAEENGKIFCVSNYNENSANKRFVEFREAFYKKYGTEPDQEAAQAYDALIVLAKAVAIARSAVPQDLASVLKNGRWDEAAGPYEFSENGALKKRRITDKVFKDKKFVEFTEETANER
ncbi:MAG: ABC transporter substrate-binding protein [Treponema sp.]|nr:ABC transporter substrate-binding protein [Treponema sp.]